ncbi:MAG: SDR family NAD(P)-dependent oxidoreductase [Methanomassiliicoccales archaeon]
MNPWDFNGKRYLVTGASRGIGRAVAEALLSANAYVVAHCNSRIELLDPLLSVYGKRIEPVSCDLSDPSGPEKLISYMQRGEIDGLVNNAGIYDDGTFTDLTDKQWDAVVEVNLKAPLKLIRRLMPQLKRSGGAVVNISSIMGIVPSAGAEAYQASKAALIHITKALAIEMAPESRVNCVAPGFIRTDMNYGGWNDPVFYKEVCDSTLLGRWGEVGDIASAVCFLLSPLSSFITGQCLLVDGGKSLSFR